MLRGTGNKDKPIWVDLVYKGKLRALGTAEQGRPRLVTVEPSGQPEVTVSQRVDAQRGEVRKAAQKGLNSFYLALVLL